MKVTITVESEEFGNVEVSNVAHYGDRISYETLTPEPLSIEQLRNLIKGTTEQALNAYPDGKITLRPAAEPTSAAEIVQQLLNPLDRIMFGRRGSED